MYSTSPDPQKGCGWEEDWYKQLRGWVCGWTNEQTGGEIELIRRPTSTFSCQDGCKGVQESHVKQEAGGGNRSCLSACVRVDERGELDLNIPNTIFKV